jgi:glycosyltransferase involved in cell wall biosynthesis
LSILFLSRIHQKKGLDILFNVLANVDFDFNLNIVGDGDMTYINELKKMSNSYNISHKISWLGSKYEHEKMNMYLEADLFVLPSLDENFANTVVESLSVGTAVLLSKSVGLSDFVVENDLGWVYNSTTEDLKLKLDEIYASREKLIDIAEKAPAIVKNKFSTKQIIQNYLNLYSQKND